MCIRDRYNRAAIDAVKAASDEETRQIWNSYIENFMSQGGEEASKAMNELLKDCLLYTSRCV